MYKRQLEHIIAAKAVCFGEALKPEFKEYQARIKENAAVLADGLLKAGFDLEMCIRDSLSTVPNASVSVSTNPRIRPRKSDRRFGPRILRCAYRSCRRDLSCLLYTS